MLLPWRSASSTVLDAVHRRQDQYVRATSVHFAALGA